MPLSNVNLLAVGASALAAMVLGFLWYGPLFGKLWMELSGISRKKIDEAKKKGMSATYLFSLAGALIMAFVLAKFVDSSGALSIQEGLEVSLWIWLGFVATSMLNSVTYEAKPIKLYLINSGYYLVSLIAMAAILVSWI